MPKAVTVTVEAINDDYGYTIVEIAPTNSNGRKPCSFSIKFDEFHGEYIFSQSGENNEWKCWPDERK